MLISNEFSLNRQTQNTQLKFNLLHLKRNFLTREFLPLDTKYIWKIEEGIVRTYTRNQNGQLLTLGFWGKDDIIGNSLSRRSFYQMECLTDVTVTKIFLHNHFLSHQDLITHLSKNETLYLINNQHQIIDRLWSLLKWLAQRFGSITDMKNEILLDFYLTHQNIAQTINTTRVGVTRTLTKLEKRGKIKRAGRDIIFIMDQEQL